MKRRYISLIIFVAILAIALSTLGVLADFRIKDRLEKKLIDDYTSQQQVVGQEVALSLQNKIENIQNSLNSLVYDKDIQSGDTEKCNAALARYNAILKLDIGNIGRVGLDGTFHCSINKALIGTSASKLGNYLDPLFKGSDHPSIISRQLKVPNVDGFVVAVHVPVYDDQRRFVGSLGGAVYLNDLIKEYLSKVKFAKTGFAGLQDDNGDIMYTQLTRNINKNYFSEEIQSQVGKPADFNQAIRDGYGGKASLVRYTIGGVSKVGSITPVNLAENHRWIVIVNVPEKEIAEIFFQAGLSNAFTVVALILVIAVLLIAILFVVVIVRNYRLQKVKDDFVSLASHQLKTPATGVKQYLSLVLHGYVGEMSPKQQKAIQDAYDSNERQLEIVNDLLDVARIDSGRIDIKKISTDLGTIVADAVKELSVETAARKQTIELDSEYPHLPAFIDADRMAMVVENLISNASKYTPAGGKIKVTLTTKGTTIFMSVSDTGVGIAPKDLSKLFSKFGRIENPLSAKVGGTGLGLYLVKSIVQLHGGAIAVRSQVGHGTTFLVTLPKSRQT